MYVCVCVCRMYACALQSMYVGICLYVYAYVCMNSSFIKAFNCECGALYCGCGPFEGMCVSLQACTYIYTYIHTYI